MYDTAAMGARLRKQARAARVALRAGPRGLGAIPQGLRGFIVQVENTNYCNFKCQYCVTHSADSEVETRRGHMSMDTYESVLDANASAGLVILQGDGEPLLDPTLFDKIASARRRGMLTQVISNGSMLTAALVERLVRDGPDMLLFSIDAVSPERNMVQRVGLKYDRVAAAVAALTTCKANGARSMLVGLLSIVHGAFDSEVETALLSFNEWGIDLLLYKQLNPAFSNRIRGYRAPRAGRVPRHVLRRLNYPVSHQRITTIAPCAQLRFDLPYYLWDGARTPCCVLNSASYATPEYEREVLLARYRARNLPGECESCTFFAGYR